MKFIVLTDVTPMILVDYSVVRSATMDDNLAAFAACESTCIVNWNEYRGNYAGKVKQDTVRP